LAPERDGETEISLREDVARAQGDALELARRRLFGGWQHGGDSCRETVVSRLVRQTKPRPDFIRTDSPRGNERGQHRLAGFGRLPAAEPEGASLVERRVAIALAPPLCRVARELGVFAGRLLVLGPEQCPLSALAERFEPLRPQLLSERQLGVTR